MSFFSLPLSSLQRVIYGGFLFLVPVFFFQIGTYWPLHPQRPNGEPVPYGYWYFSAEKYSLQDFAYNLNFFSQIWHQTVSRPYQLAEQEKIVQNWNPAAHSGLAHGYSPVGLVLALPFVFLPPWLGYLIYLFLILVELLLLIRFYLLPRARHSLQVILLLPVILSFSYVIALGMGQTSLFTTGVFAAVWWLLQKREAAPARAGWDFLLAVLLWSLCLKPNLALVGLSLALGCRAWRSVFFLGGLLLLTWLAVGNCYGGWITGLQDYSQLLNHYHRSALTPFFQPDSALFQCSTLNVLILSFFPSWEDSLFLITRYLFPGLCLLATLLCWRKLVSRSEFFQMLLWILLVFSPYLLVTEDWVICLLVVEGTFFRPARGIALKVLLLLLIVDSRLPDEVIEAFARITATSALSDSILYCRLAVVAKLSLGIWWLVELLAQKSAILPNKEISHEPA